MIGDYIVVAIVYGIGLSFLGFIHYFWLRDEFKEEAPLDVCFKDKEKYETPVREALSAAKASRHEPITAQLEDSRI
jgi:hypothetical protein